jgi:predicted RNase H-like nuclease
MTATDQEIAEILAAIGQNLKRLVAVETANIVFQLTGQMPEDKRTRAGSDLERGPRPPDPPHKD